MFFLEFRSVFCKIVFIFYFAACLHVWVKNNSFEVVVENGYIFLRGVDGRDVNRSICYFLDCMGSDIGPVNFWHNGKTGVKTVKLLKI